MPKTIWKHALVVGDSEYQLQLPQDAEFLCIQVQNEQVCVWFLHDTEVNVLTDHTVFCYGTGHPIQYFVGIGDYLGTTQHMDGSLVLHWFMKS